MTKTIVYHHNDLDGYVSAAIVKTKFKDCKFIECKYGKTTPQLEDYSSNNVFIVDFSFDEETMDQLSVATDSLTWIDHHETVKKHSPKLWNRKDILGIREIGKSGALLTWEYLYPNEEPPDIVKLTNDYDLWILQYSESKPLAAYVANFIDSPKRLYKWVANRTTKMAFSSLGYVISQGKLLQESRQSRIEKMFRDGFDAEYTNGITCRYCNCSISTDMNDLGNYICKEKGYDIAVMWRLSKDKLVYGLRSRSSKYNVGEIARKNGGGGHDQAAGFTRGVDDLFAYKNILLW